jgi:hypothetical protein
MIIVSTKSTIKRKDVNNKLTYASCIFIIFIINIEGENLVVPSANAISMTFVSNAGIGFFKCTHHWKTPLRTLSAVTSVIFRASSVIDLSSPCPPVIGHCILRSRTLPSLMPQPLNLVSYD